MLFLLNRCFLLNVSVYCSQKLFINIFPPEIKKIYDLTFRHPAERRIKRNAFVYYL
jgi:hypothetical protein